VRQWIEIFCANYDNKMRFYYSFIISLFHICRLGGGELRLYWIPQGITMPKLFRTTALDGRESLAPCPVRFTINKSSPPPGTQWILFRVGLWARYITHGIWGRSLQPSEIGSMSNLKMMCLTFHVFPHIVTIRNIQLWVLWTCVKHHKY
jgi:hypothetical protein